MQYIYNSFNENEYKFVVFIDLLKAFDTFNYNILPKKAKTLWYKK